MAKITLKEFKNLYDEYDGCNNVFNWWLVKNYPDLVKEAEENCTFWQRPQKLSLTAKIIFYALGIHEYQHCPVCNKESYIIPTICKIDNYIENPDVLRFCKSHFYSSDFYQNRMKQFYLEKYGVDNPNKLEDVKKKVQETLHLHYGEDGLKNEEIRNKKKNTNIERYGVEFNAQAECVKKKIKEAFDAKYDGHPLRCPEIQEKFRNTCLQRFGAVHPMMNDEIRIKQKQSNIDNHNGVFFSNTPKRKQTFIDRYGLDNPSKVKEIRDKVIMTNLSHFGTEYSFQSEIVKQKIKETTIERYGVDNVSKNSEIHEKQVESIKKVTRQKSYSKLTAPNRDVFLKSSFDDFIKYQNGQLDSLVWYCNNCHTQFSAKRDSNWEAGVRCWKCHPHIVSNFENYMCDFLTECGVSVSRHRKDIISPKEVDIYIDDKNIAIECNGLYWHSTQYHLDPQYHKNKTIDCERKGIQLIHIFEDDFYHKREIVTSRLKNLLGIYDKTLFARKCIIKEVSASDTRIFLNLNHIQGYCTSKYNYGLYYNDELVSIMTFGSYRKVLGREKKDNEYELLRYCCKLGYHIPGAASKLLKMFERTVRPKILVSYADRCWSTGNLYYKLGFELLRETDPGYCYIIGNKRENRFKWRKSELPKLLNNVDMSLSEEEIMNQHNFYRLYDSGNYCFRKTYQN